MDKVIQQLIVESGVDNEARPMLLFNSCHLPDPKLYNYDRLAEAAMKKLDQYVENDYVIILFTANTQHRPSWRWVYKAYRLLSRKYRKHLKVLYVVHPSLWIRILMDAMKLIISPKFAKKLYHVETLSKLAELVPFRQLKIPDPVLIYNLTLEPSVMIPNTSTALNHQENDSNRQFGVPLEKLMSEDGDTIPPVIGFCVEYIRKHGLETEGIFRRSPSSVELKHIKAEFDTAQSSPNFDRYTSPVHLAAVCIKLFLRELPQPLFPPQTYDSLERRFATSPSYQNTATDRSQSSLELDTSLKDGDLVYILRNFFPQLTTPSRRLLFYLLDFFANDLCVPERVPKHKMSPLNIGIVLGPNLVRCSDSQVLREVELSRCATQVIRIAIENWNELQSVP